MACILHGSGSENDIPWDALGGQLKGCNNCPGESSFKVFRSWSITESFESKPSGAHLTFSELF